MSILKNISAALDGDGFKAPDGDNTCPFAEGCKRTMSPGMILRYSAVTLASMFGLLFVLSLFFPDYIRAPDIAKVKELVDLVLSIIRRDV